MHLQIHHIVIHNYQTTAACTSANMLHQECQFASLMMHHPVQKSSLTFPRSLSRTPKISDDFPATKHKENKQLEKKFLFSVRYYLSALRTRMVVERSGYGLITGGILYLPRGTAENNTKSRHIQFCEQECFLKNNLEYVKSSVAYLFHVNGYFH